MSQRPEDNALVKIIKLNPLQLSYRLALEAVDYKPDAIPLDAIYSGLLSVKKVRDRYFNLYTICVALLFFLDYNVVTSLSLMGVNIDGDLARLSALMIVSWVTLNYSYFQSKILRYDNLFNAKLARVSQAEAQNLILKYPEAYNALQFNYYIVGRPRFMMPVRVIPVRLTASILLMLVAAVTCLAFWIFLLCQTTYLLWNNHNALGVFWTRVVVVASWVVLAFSATIPTVNTGNRTYRHYGLVETSEKLRKHNPRRYTHFAALVRYITRK